MTPWPYDRTLQHQRSVTFTHNPMTLRPHVRTLQHQRSAALTLTPGPTGPYRPGSRCRGWDVALEPEGSGSDPRCSVRLGNRWATCWALLREWHWTVRWEDVLMGSDPQGAFLCGIRPAKTRSTAPTTRPTRSWTGSCARSPRCPARARPPAKGGGAGPTASHVSVGQNQGV